MLHKSDPSRLKSAAIFLPMLLVTGIAQASPDVNYVLVGKSIDYLQTSAGSPVLNPKPVSASYGGPYGFGVDILGSNLQSLPTPHVSGPFSAAMSASTFFNGGDLVYDTSSDAWRLGRPNANDWGGTSLTQLNDNFGDGVYTVSVGQTSVSLNLHGDLYPNIPFISLSGGHWANGEYVIAANQALTITSNSFSDNADSVGVLSVGGLFQDIQLGSNTPGANIISYTIAANTLQAGNLYNGNMSFLNLVDIANIPNHSGVLAAAHYTSDTSFSILAVPEPASTWQLFSGLLGIAAVARRKSAV